MTHPARHLPPLNDVLQRRAVRGLLRRLRRDVVVQLVREALAHERSVATGTGAMPSTRADALRAVERRVIREAERLLRPKLSGVINASGVLLHTNLGRAKLCAAAADEVRRVACEPVALEIDLWTGRRGKRHEKVEQWLRLLTGTEAALVVNNGAGALWLAVHVLGRRRRAIVSRGELVAIGGSFRMPDLLRTTGARLVEVGTTNKTGLNDYAREVRADDVVVKVHPSNYRLVGFTEEASLAELASLADERGAHLVFDAGSGSLVDFARYGLAGEVPLTEVLAQGPGLVTCSGDKLLGGPQAGLVLGRQALVERLGRSPVLRALRCDKLTLAGLEATLREYARASGPPDLPLLAELKASLGSLRERARTLRDRVAEDLPRGWRIAVERGTAAVGGGSFAETPVPSYQVVLRPPRESWVAALQEGLRRADPAVLALAGEGAVRFDVRACRAPELELLARAIRTQVRGLDSAPPG